MVKIGDVLLFRANTEPHDETYREFFLRYLGNDDNAMLMSGMLPHLWLLMGMKPTGPTIESEDYEYQVKKVDYEQGLVWLLIIRRVWPKDLFLPNTEFPIKSLRPSVPSGALLSWKLPTAVCRH